MAKKHYSLVGVDGNAFCVMGYVMNAMEEQHYTKEEIDEYLEDAKSSDYNHLLAVSAMMIADINSKK